MRIQQFVLCTFVFLVGLWCAVLPVAEAADTANLSLSGGITIEEALIARS